MAKLFVFGTLKKGFALHDYLGGALYLGLYRTVQHYPMLIAGELLQARASPSPGGAGIFGTGKGWDRRTPCLYRRMDFRQIPIGCLATNPQLPGRTLREEDALINAAGCQPATMGKTNAVVLPVSGRDISASVRAAV
jgi:hypothetical protein